MRDEPSAIGRSLHTGPWTSAAACRAATLRTLSTRDSPRRRPSIPPAGTHARRAAIVDPRPADGSSARRARGRRRRRRDPARAARARRGRSTSTSSCPSAYEERGGRSSRRPGRRPRHADRRRRSRRGSTGRRPRRRRRPASGGLLLPRLRAPAGAAAAAHAGRLVFSHPPRTWLTRCRGRLGNRDGRVLGRSYRGYVHPPEAMADVVRRARLRAPLRHRGLSWCIVGAVRG